LIELGLTVTSSSLFSKRIEFLEGGLNATVGIVALRLKCHRVKSRNQPFVNAI